MKNRIEHNPSPERRRTISSKHWLLPLIFLLLASVAHSNAPLGVPVSLQLTHQGEQGVLIEWTPSGEPAWHIVQYRDSFSDGSWLPCPPEDQWPSNAAFYLDPRPATGARFYRVVSVPAPAVDRGRLISAEQILSLGRSEISLMMAFAGVSGMTPTHGIVFYKVLYETVDPRGQSTVASGSLVVPQGETGPMPLASYQHGTILDKEQAPSRFGSIDSLPGVFLASAGYLTASPDLLGLGDSPGFHPYMVTEPTVTAALDMLRAARTFFETEALHWNEQLFLFGVSQGGHTTLALHREIEAAHTDEFTVTASAPVSGPYDLSGTMTDVILDPAPYPSPYYLPYVLLAYNDAYQLYDTLDDVFVEPHADSIRAFRAGSKTASEFQSGLPSVPRTMLQPEFLEAFETDPDHPWRVVLRENDVYDWAPQAPVRLYHCAGDGTVPKANAEIALSQFQANGAVQVELIDPLPAGDHVTCTIPSLLDAKVWFDSLREE